MTKDQLQALEELRNIIDVCHQQAEALAGYGYVSTESLRDIMKLAKEKLHVLRAICIE